jgi:hypothetical protein
MEAAAAPGAPETVSHRARGWLGVVRWWAGDLAGADAALDTVTPDAFSLWARAEVALARSDLPGAESAAEASLGAAGREGGETSPALGQSVLARVALSRGDPAAAAPLAEAAYRAGVTSGGLDLAVGAPPHAWILVDEGRWSEARAVADSIRRQVGRYDAFARTHVALIELAVAVAGEDRAARRDAEGSLQSLRQAGFAALEEQARTLVTALAAPRRAVVLMLGPCVVQTGDRRLARADWRSQKALEVLRFLALAGGRGTSREEVIEAVWPEREPDRGRTLLRTALVEIRRMLEPSRPRGEPSAYLAAQADRLMLDAWTDVAEARRLATDDPAGALAMFRGPFFEDDPFVEWAADEGRSLDALRTAVASKVAMDRTAPAALRRVALEVLVAAEPWRPEHAARLAELTEEG